MALVFTRGSRSLRQCTAPYAMRRKKRQANPEAGRKISRGKTPRSSQQGTVLSTGFEGCATMQRRGANPAWGRGLARFLPRSEEGGPSPNRDLCPKVPPLRSRETNVKEKKQTKRETSVTVETVVRVRARESNGTISRGDNTRTEIEECMKKNIGNGSDEPAPPATEGGRQWPFCFGLERGGAPHG